MTNDEALEILAARNGAWATPSQLGIPGEILNRLLMSGHVRCRAYPPGKSQYREYAVKEETP